MYSGLKNLPRHSLRVSAAISLLAAPLLGPLQVCAAQDASQRTFPSAEAASDALFAAVQAQDTGTLTQILGSNTELVSSNDATQDRHDRERFTRKYREMHRLARERNGEVVLYIGAENWPFPVPLVARNGVWRYDTDAGKEEVLYRRIGEDEITAIETCHALIAAAEVRKAHAEANDPVGILLDNAQANNTANQFHGYHFRILANSGSAASTVVAYPGDYDTSGVMTFIVNGRGAVYEKDLGPQTAKAAEALTAFRLDSSWKPAETALTP